MTTYVVLTGLMLLVPRTDAAGTAQSLTILVLETDNVPEQFGHHPIQQHWATVKNLGGPDGPPLDGAWTLQSLSEGGLAIDDRAKFLLLEEIYDDMPPRVREECLGEHFATRCTEDNRPLLRAKISVEGGWRVRPVAVDQARAPRADVHDDSLWGVLQVPEDGLPLARSGYQTALASGVILEPLGGGEVEFHRDGERVLTELSPSAKCGFYVGVVDECAVVRFTNTTMPAQHAPPVGDHLEIDVHFNLVYELFDPVPAIRYLPFLRAEGSADAMTRLGYTGGGTVGETRPCPPAAIAPSVPR